MIKSNTKAARILGEFLKGGELHRFTAEKLGDHVLHSTVSGFERRGLIFTRRDVFVPGWGGHETRVTAYKLSPESIELGRRLVGHPVDKRKDAGAVQEARAYLLASRG